MEYFSNGVLGFPIHVCMPLNGTWTKLWKIPDGGHYLNFSSHIALNEIDAGQKHISCISYLHCYCSAVESQYILVFFPSLSCHEIVLISEISFGHKYTTCLYYCLCIMTCKTYTYVGTKVTICVCGSCKHSNGKCSGIYKLKHFSLVLSFQQLYNYAPVVIVHNWAPVTTVQMLFQVSSNIWCEQECWHLSLILPVSIIVFSIGHLRNVPHQHSLEKIVIHLKAPGFQPLR